MFDAVDARPDLVSIEHEMLRRWRDEGVFERLRAQTTGGPRWSFLDGPITANNPMGVHHAWGRTYKDIFQRFRASLGHELRWQQGFDCQGLWVEVNVERELGYTSKRQIEEQGLAAFIRLCKQRVLTYAARQTEQSIRLGMWMDWNDPADLLKLRDALAEIGPGADVTPIAFERVKPRTLIMIIVGSIAGYVLLSQLAQVDLVGLLRTADWRWMAAALGLSRAETIRQIILPQVFRIVLPSFGNQYISLTKSTSLGIAIGYPDLFNVYGTISNQTGRNLEGILIVMLIYLLLSWVISALVNFANARLVAAGAGR